MGELRILLRMRRFEISWMEEWGAFRHNGNVKADYMKKAATNALIHVFYTLPYSCGSAKGPDLLDRL